LKAAATIAQCTVDVFNAVPLMVRAVVCLPHHSHTRFTPDRGALATTPTGATGSLIDLWQGVTPSSTGTIPGAPRACVAGVPVRAGVGTGGIHLLTGGAAEAVEATAECTRAVLDAVTVAVAVRGLLHHFNTRPGASADRTRLTA
jgi:hypothetical protein